ncbi:hypothetical protein RB195_005249 [Necator americanus]|uniref:Reverse transcriptase domain-containing protein n=1 Tax=Necator americanus TaxID=51031 RepID=A0ABR1BQT4_NECAM
MRLCTIPRSLKLWIVSAHAPTETVDDHKKDAFYDEFNTLISKIKSQQAVIVGIDANAKMGPEKYYDVLGKWFYPLVQTSDNGNHLIDLCEQTRGIIDAVCLRGVGPFLFNFVVYDIMRRTVEQCLADVILAPFARTLVDLEYVDDVTLNGNQVDGQPIELVDEFCYLGCMLKNDGSYGRDIQQRCAEANSAFTSLTKCAVSTPIANEVKLPVYLSAILSS